MDTNISKKKKSTFSLTLSKELKVIKLWLYLGLFLIFLKIVFSSFLLSKPLLSFFNLGSIDFWIKGWLFFVTGIGTLVNFSTFFFPLFGQFTVLIVNIFYLLFLTYLLFMFRKKGRYFYTQFYTIIILETLSLFFLLFLSRLLWEGLFSIVTLLIAISIAFTIFNIYILLILSRKEVNNYFHQNSNFLTDNQSL